MSQGNPVTPFTFWRSYQDATLEIWAMGMAVLIDTEAFSQALNSYLTNYLATSEVLWKQVEQITERRLAKGTSPTGDITAHISETQKLVRDHITRADTFKSAHNSRIITLERRLERLMQEYRARVDDVNYQLQAIVEHLDESQQRMTSFDERITRYAVEQTQRLGTLDTRFQSLADEQTQRLSDIDARLQSLTNEHAQRMSDLEQRLQSLTNEHAQRVGDLEQRLQSMMNEHAQRFSDLENRFQSLAMDQGGRITDTDNRVNWFVGEQGAAIAEIRAHLNAIDERYGQLHHLVTTLEQRLPHQG